MNRLSLEEGEKCKEGEETGGCCGGEEGLEVKEENKEKVVKCFFECGPRQITSFLTTFEETASFSSLGHNPLDHMEILSQMRFFILIFI